MYIGFHQEKKYKGYRFKTSQLSTIVAGISKHSNHLGFKNPSFFCDVLWIPNIAESFWWSNSPSRNCVSKIAKYAHFCRKNHNMNKRASKFCTFLGLLYISEKICTFHFLSQTGIGPLHCQSYARQSNMGKCHKLVLGLKFWSVYIFKSPLAATALSPFSISYLRKRDW